MQTITIRDLKNHLSLALERFQWCMEEPADCPWPEINTMSPEQAKKQLVTARRRARRNLERLDRELLGDGYAILAFHWISYVLIAHIRYFVVNLRGSAAGLQQQEEVDLRLIAALGVEIKHLGFQLDA